MKKYLIRAGFTPFDNFTPEYILENIKLLGNNSGNMLYAYSVWRTLMTEDCELTPTQYKYTYTDSEVDEINATYSAFIIPLANAFRNDFQKELIGLTSFIKRLKMPVYVIGVGINFPYEPDFNSNYPFDDTVKAFVSAVLEKSSIIGVRGALTVKYLEGLGFKEDKHVMAIGCPSMYTFGEKLSIREPNITKDSKIVFNHSTQAPDNVLALTRRTLEQFPNHTMILQTAKEFTFTYSGASYMYKSDKDFPCKLVSDSLYIDNKIRFFINEPSWLDFVKNSDFSFGPRLHGNIAAVISGTPSLMLPKDARMRELSDYHNLTCAKVDEITEQTNMLDLIEKADFNAPLKVQSDNFARYVDFLNKNGIEHIYKDDNNPKNTPFDKKIADIKFNGGIGTLYGCDRIEMAKRLDNFFKINWEKTTGLEKRVKRLRKQAGETDGMRRMLESRPVKFALKLKNLIKK